MNRNLAAILALAAGLVAAGCSQGSHAQKAGLEIQAGSDVTLERKDGVTVAGRLVEVTSDRIIVERRDGGRAAVSRSDIAAVRTEARAPRPAEATSHTPDPAGGAAGSAALATADHRDSGSAPARRDPAAERRTPAFREVTAPAGTVLLAELASAVSSDSSDLEDPVRATLRQPLRVNGEQVLPAGTTLVGHVTAAERSARVKGRARVAFRFTAIDSPGGERRIRTDAISRTAPATKKQDAAKIGGGAAGGAIIGGILGGGDGAAKGAAIGGAAGTGVVLSTRGKEVRLGPGADISIRLAAPVTFRVPVR
jgi:hypothetical protein